MELENWVVKSNALVEHRGRMTALEQKIIAVLASEITPEDEDFKDYEFSIKEFISITGSNETAIYNQIHESAQKLMKKIITIRDGKSRISVPMIGFVKTLEGQGKVIMRFDKCLKEEFLGLQKLFTQYQLKHVLNLKGAHSIRIYELLKQYQKIKKREFTVVELKEMLGVTDSYSAFKDFELRILRTAKDEINEKSDLWISYQKVKKGRAIDRIIFEIEPKYGNIDVEADEIKLYKPFDGFDYANVREKTSLTVMTISDKQLREIFEIAQIKTAHPTYELDVYEYIRINYEYSKERAKTGLFSYLKKAIEADYANARIKLLGLE